MSGNVRSDGLHVCICMCKGICIGIDMCYICVCVYVYALVVSRLVLSRLVLRDSGRMFRVSLLRCLLCPALSCKFFCFQWWLVSYRFVRTVSHLSGRPLLFLRYLGSLSESDGFGFLLCGFLCVCCAQQFHLHWFESFGAR